MRKVRLDIDSVKQKIAAMQGSRVQMMINRGRKKIIQTEGEIADIYPSVFTVRTQGARGVELLSYSFSDVLCGDVKITEAKDG